MSLSSGTVSVFQRLASDGLEYRLEYLIGWNSKNLKSPQKRWKPRFTGFRPQKKTP